MAIQSKLGVNKVCKTTVVGMDIKQEHIDTGLVQPQAHWHFKAPTSSNATPEAASTNFEPDYFEDIQEFDELAAQLIADAAKDVDTDSDIDNNNSSPSTVPTLSLTIWLPVHAIQAALLDSTPP